MITDIIDNAGKYTALNRFLPQCFLFILQFRKSPKAAGRYEIDGDNCFALVQEYKTSPEHDCAEFHRKYIDLQFVFSGRERIGYFPLPLGEIIVKYDPATDYGKSQGPVSWLILEPGMFAAFYPDDAHIPGICAGKPQNVVKIVFKIAVS